MIPAIKPASDIARRAGEACLASTVNANNIYG
jgi:hypothetical protein